MIDVFPHSPSSQSEEGDRFALTFPWLRTPSALLSDIARFWMFVTEFQTSPEGPESQNLAAYVASARTTREELWRCRSRLISSEPCSLSKGSARTFHFWLDKPFVPSPPRSLQRHYVAFVCVTHAEFGRGDPGAGRRRTDKCCGQRTALCMYACMSVGLFSGNQVEKCVQELKQTKFRGRNYAESGKVLERLDLFKFTNF